MNALNLLKAKFIGQLLIIFISDNGEKFVIDGYSKTAINNGTIQLSKVIDVVYVTNPYNTNEAIPDNNPHFEFVFEDGWRFPFGVC